MRTARVERKTKETNICLELNLDGAGIFEGTTGIGFFDNMLDGFARHGFFDLRLEMEGDLQVDGHHTIEDLGIVLGTALKEALKGTDIEAVKAKQEELQKALFAVSEKVYKEAAAKAQAEQQAQPEGEAKKDDNVYDAEYTDVNDQESDKK